MEKIEIETLNDVVTYLSKEIDAPSLQYASCDKKVHCFR